jgi:hypothetical protein
MIGVPLMKRATNTWSVYPRGDKTLLTSRAELVLKGGIFGQFIEPVMMLMMRRMAPDSLAAFKYLVENGRPYAGKHSELPRAPISC